MAFDADMLSVEAPGSADKSSAASSNSADRHHKTEIKTLNVNDYTQMGKRVVYLCKFTPECCSVICNRTLAMKNTDLKRISEAALLTGL